MKVQINYTDQDRRELDNVVKVTFHDHHAEITLKGSYKERRKTYEYVKVICVPYSNIYALSYTDEKEVR